MQPNNLALIKQEQARRDLAATRHKEQLAASGQVSDTVLAVAEAVIKYIEGRTADVTITNPVTSVSTPDVASVVEGLQLVDQTLQNQEKIDLSELTELVKSSLEQLEKLPKDHATITIPKPVDNSAELKELKQSVDQTTKAIKAQKTTVEAPKVEVKAPVVNVDAPDLKPIEDASKQLEKTIKVGQEEQREASNKSASALITEPFDEYKVMYSVPFDEEEPVITGIKYYLKGRLSTTLKYTYDKKGNLTGGKRV